MAAPRVLSVGKDPILMASRTLLLRNAGYAMATGEHESVARRHASASIC
jgi:hypothetical protein